jgi:hypothetical protein
MDMPDVQPLVLNAYIIQKKEILLDVALNTITKLEKL